MSDLVALLDLADIAIARAETAIDDESRRELARVVRRARRKLGFVGEALVVAFAGGTGSGKSSLVNALVADEIAPAGLVRPTTNEALAAIPMGSLEKFGRLLGDLGVAERIEVDALRSTVLVDLPDFDSTELAHRHVVESVLPVVDAVVWVFDPEKYSDRVVHRDFLAGLTAYENQFVFVLNQTDRLGDQVQPVVDDLRSLLGEDGYTAPEVVASIAKAPDTDVSDLVKNLYRRLDNKRTVVSKIATDVRIAAGDGWSAGVHALEGATDVAERDTIGLAAATFVSLGIAAIEVLSGIEES